MNINTNTFGYIRVSTADQNTDIQKNLLLQKYPNINLIFEDIGSGKNMDRKGYRDMERFLRPGDTVVIESFSRISRSTKDLLQLIQDYQEKDIQLISLKESFDYKTPQGKLYLVILSALVEFEREILLERQREGIAIAKSEGKYKGRKRIPLPQNFNECYERFLNRENKYTFKNLMRDTKLKRSTLYLFIKEYNQNKK